MTRKLRLRLEIMAALPEPILLDRLRRLSVAELTVFRRLYGIRECKCKGRCRIQQFGELRAARLQVTSKSRSRRFARRQKREMHSNPTSMYQTRCQCAAARQAMSPIPFSVHQLLAKLLLPEGEKAPHRPRTRPNRNRTRQHAA